MAKKFQRRKENFTCEKCGIDVIGDGYTDHCPACLWSKHVDINPGDRASTCHGAMEPTAVEGTTEKYGILYKCARCGVTHRVKTHTHDSADAIIALAAKRAKAFSQS